MGLFFVAIISETEKGLFVCLFCLYWVAILKFGFQSTVKAVLFSHVTAVMKLPNENYLSLCKDDLWKCKDDL